MPALFLSDGLDFGDGLRLISLPPSHISQLTKVMAVIDPWRRMAISYEDLEDYFYREDPGLHRYALIHETIVMGVVAIRPHWMQGPYIEMLAILPDFQGRGLGRIILRWLEGEAQERARNLWVAVSDFNSHGIGFYEDFGFERVAELDGLVRDGFTELLLRKRLV